LASRLSGLPWDWLFAVNVEKLSLKDEKTVLRVKFRDLRAKFAADSGEAAGSALRDFLNKWLRQNLGGDQLCSYRAVNGEPEPNVRPLTEMFFPRLEGKSLAFYRPLKAEAFTPNKFGILEPSPDASEPLNLKKPVVVLTPAVAVDSLGRRIGSGLGFYDQFFQANPNAMRLGVVYHVQVSQNPLPYEGWDQSLDWIITDKMILRVSQRSS
jgi:5-formyltetrahydrofolate cyclo-ligase